MRRIPPDLINPQGADQNYTFVGLERIGPLGHAVGRRRAQYQNLCRSRGQGRPLSVLVTGGQRNDGAVFTDVVDQIWVPSLSGAAGRTRPDAVLDDKGYTTSGNRHYLRQRGIKAVIPERSDQQRARKREGSKDGRPPSFDVEAYQGRHVVENHFGRSKQ